MTPSIIRQGLMRVLALSLPLVIVVSVRYSGSELFVREFFVLLTDGALLVAVTKLGIDVYLPSCKLQGKSVVVLRKYKIAYVLLGLGLLLLAILSHVLEGYWQLFIVVSFVLSCLGIAEIGRLKAQFFIFYLLKSPALYLSALLIASLSESLLSLIFCSAAVLAMWYWLSSSMKVGDHGITTNLLLLSSLASLAILVFSWKEAALSRYGFGSAQIDSLVMYTRLVLIVTFPFMLHNARVPLLIQRLNEEITEKSVRDILRQHRFKSVSWAIATSILIVVYAWVFEPELVWGAAYLMGGACVLVAFGNIGAILVSLREYRALLLCYLLGTLAFIIAAYIVKLILPSGSIFTAISLASLVAQVVFSLFLISQLQKTIIRIEIRKEQASSILQSI